MATLPADQRAYLEQQTRRLEAAVVALKRHRPPERAPRDFGSAVAGFQSELRAVRARLQRLSSP